LDATTAKLEQLASRVENSEVDDIKELKNGVALAYAARAMHQYAVFPWKMDRSMDAETGVNLAAALDELGRGYAAAGTTMDADTTRFVTTAREVVSSLQQKGKATPFQVARAREQLRKEVEKLMQTVEPPEKEEAPARPPEAAEVSMPAGPEEAAPSTEPPSTPMPEEPEAAPMPESAPAPAAPMPGEAEGAAAEPPAVPPPAPAPAMP
jgi:hypothetical protein